MRTGLLQVPSSPDVLDERNSVKEARYAQYRTKKNVSPSGRKIDRCLYREYLVGLYVNNNTGLYGILGDSVVHITNMGLAGLQYLRSQKTAQ
ncbi:MAG: hypothetical protein LLF94_02260 [Chlamydiales bacterium]|nr:hypothetical protein [Chlamydiales bacterium]